MKKENGEERKEVIARVITGDSFRTKSGKTIRLAGVRLPKAGEPGYAEAKDNLDDLLIEGKEVFVSAIRRGDDGVEVANVHVVTTSFVNDEMRSFMKVSDRVEVNREDLEEKIEVEEKKSLRQTLRQWVGTRVADWVDKYIIYPILVLVGGILWELIQFLWAWLGSAF